MKISAVIIIIFRFLMSSSHYLPFNYCFPFTCQQHSGRWILPAVSTKCAFQKGKRYPQSTKTFPNKAVMFYFFPEKVTNLLSQQAIAGFFQYKSSMVCEKDIKSCEQMKNLCQEGLRRSPSLAKFVRVRWKTKPPQVNFLLPFCD